MERSVQMVEAGKECRHKAYLDHFAFTAEVPIQIAEELGYQGPSWGLPERCPIRPGVQTGTQAQLFTGSSGPYEE